MDKILYGLLGGAVSALGLGLIYEFLYNKKRLDAVKLELTNKMKTMDSHMTAVASAINTAAIPNLTVNYPTAFPASQSSPMDLEAAKQLYLSKIKNAVASVKAGDVKVYKSPTKQVSDEVVPEGVKMYKTTESPIKVELTKVPQIVPEITSYKESK